MSTIVFLLMLLGALLICCLCAKTRQARFECQFPPISDAEFVARCAPGTDPAVALRVRRVLSDCLNVEYERIHPSARLVEDLGAD